MENICPELYEQESWLPRHDFWLQAEASIPGFPSHKNRTFLLFFGLKGLSWKKYVNGSLNSEGHLKNKK
jgi:hypothetical protein